MNDGSRVLQWAHQNGYALTWIAEQIDYAPEELWRELHQDRITQALARACRVIGRMLSS